MAGATVEDGLPSPGNKIKFMCSHGGKILPRPIDGQLKYVGGDTRVIALMKKLNSLFEGDLVLKYQLAPEDLDALVSVTCDEDLKHMMDEYDRYDAKLSGNSSAPRLRAFLFPSNPVVVDSHGSNSGEAGGVLEQRYIDAINGFVRSSSNVGRSIYYTEPGNRDIGGGGGLETPPEPPVGRFRSMEPGMGRVHSSPNLLAIPHQAAPANHHPPPLQLRLGRPGANLQLQTARGAGGGGQMGRRYCVTGYPGPVGNGGYVGYPGPHKETTGPYRSASAGSAEGGAYPSSQQQQQQQRLGPPMGQLRWE
ncbi:hypothetical protein ACLOJK_014239 [Asimina triloba]